MICWKGYWHLMIPSVSFLSSFCKRYSCALDLIQIRDAQPFLAERRGIVDLEKRRMSHVPHEITEEFPHLVAEMTSLKSQDAHFARLLDEYHSVNRAIHRAEVNVEPVADFHMIDLRKKRLSLKDEIASCLALA